jgi:hypothetical protein
VRGKNSKFSLQKVYVISTLKIARRRSKRRSLYNIELLLLLLLLLLLFIIETQIKM